MAKPPRSWRIWSRPASGRLSGGRCVELVVAYGSEQDGVGGEAGVEGRWGSGVPVCGDGDAADEGFVEGEVVGAVVGDLLEDGDGFAGDFGADAVAGEDGDVESSFHSSLLLLRAANLQSTSCQTVGFSQSRSNGLDLLVRR